MRIDYYHHYKDSHLVLAIAEKIREINTIPWRIMEICGGQTHAIKKYGLDQLLPEKIELIHGPGCPVCVTSLELIDKAIDIASKQNVIFTSYGDMLRVPGSKKDLLTVKAEGSDIRVVYSPLDAVTIAQQNPDAEVVFFAIGFETTAPANAMSVLYAQKNRVNNFSLLVSHVRVPPALQFILSSPDNKVQGLLAAGHVCAVMGYWEYIPIAQKYCVPIVVTGFEPVDILNGILLNIQQLESRKSEVENAYSRVVSLEGNRPAQAVINQVFQSCDRNWRGIGEIKSSGWNLKPEFENFNAENRFEVAHITPKESPDCIAGLVLQGLKKPVECSAFRSQCTPSSPLGATMVSSEGACAAYFHYHTGK
jgi:hydrogenase expression/formation protein HypD